MGRKGLRSIVSVLLSVALVVTEVPTSAWAEAIDELGSTSVEEVVASDETGEALGDEVTGDDTNDVVPDGQAESEDEVDSTTVEGEGEAGEADDSSDEGEVVTDESDDQGAVTDGDALDETPTDGAVTEELPPAEVTDDEAATDEAATDEAVTDETATDETVVEEEALADETIAEEDAEDAVAEDDLEVPTDEEPVEATVELQVLQNGYIPDPEVEAQKAAEAAKIPASKKRRIAAVKAMIVNAFYNVSTKRIDISSYKLTTKEYESLEETIIDENPDLFYVSHATYTYYPSNSLVAEFVPKYISSDVSSIKSWKREYEAAIQDALSWVPTETSSSENLRNHFKIKAIHDYLVAKCSYNTPAVEDTYSYSDKKAAYGINNPWTSYGALVYHRPVCEGYSLAFKALMNRMGFSCNAASQWLSKSSGHVWNRVKVNGKWYHVDVTWDDDDVIGSSFYSDWYFLRSDNWMHRNSTWDSDNYGYWHDDWYPASPACTDTSFDDAQKGDWYQFTGPWNDQHGTWLDPPTNHAPYSPDKFSLNKTSLTMKTRAQYTLYIKSITPTDFQKGEAKWKSSNTKILKVDSTGHLTSTGVPGKVTITCTIGGVKRTCKVHVKLDLSEYATAKLAKKTYAYTSRQVKPNPTVKANSKTLKKNRDYTVSYKNNIKVGTATVTVKGKGNYMGSRKLTFKIKVFKVKWVRLAGAGRYLTMQAIVKKGWSKKGGTVIVATGQNFKDALSASGLAGLYGAPVILTPSNKLCKEARAQLKRLKPKRVYVIGGKLAISNGVLNQIRSATGVKPKRLSGKNSASTSAAICRAGKGKWKSKTAIIATNKSYKDALSVAPVSYVKHYPILLADNGKSLSKDVLNTLKKCGIKKVIIVGGTAAVTPRVVKQLKKKGIKVSVRLGGKTGTGTSYRIAAWGIKHGLRATGMAFATSQNYPDALAGAAFCGKKKSVLVLADDKCPGNLSFARKYRKTIVQGYVFGGTYVFSNSLFRKLPK